MMPALLDKVADVVHRDLGPRDALGRPALVEVSRDVDVLCRIDQRGSREGEAYVVDEFNAIFGPEVDLGPLDRVISGGQTYEVLGTPTRYGLPVPGVDHVEVSLKRVGAVT